MRRRINPKPLRKALVSWAILALALGPAAPALAAAGTGTTTTGSIVITQELSHPARAYQVFDGDVDGDGSVTDIRWGTGVNVAGLESALAATPEFAGCDTARKVAEKLKVASQTDETDLAKLFAKIVSRNLNPNGGKAFSDTETPTASNLDDGWYVIASDYGTDLAEGAALLFPSLITVGSGEVRVTPKESTPTLVKEVQEDSTGRWQSYADFEIGQSFQQRLTATIGDAPLSYYQSYYLGFTDTLSDGLDLDDSTIKVTIDGVDKTSLFTVDFADGKLTVESPNILGSIKAGSSVVVTYTTTLNAQADRGTPGNVNSATLTYSADPRATQGGIEETRNVTPETEATSYTYELQLTKTDAADSSRALAGAKFMLRRTKDNKYAVLSGADGTVDAATNNNTGNTQVTVTGWADTPEAGGYVTTDADGHANIVGLDAEDKYVLTEVVAPDGYDLDSTPIPFEVSANPASNAPLTELSVSVNGGTAADGVISTGLVGAGVTNVKAPILPVTGLGGIVASVVLGSGLVAAAATVIARQASRGSRE